MSGRCAALIAQQKQGEDGADTDFYTAKLATCRFYGEHYLPQVSGLAAAVVDGAGSVLDMPEALF